MDIFIRQSAQSDLQDYTLLLQSIYQEVYTDETLKLTPECFSLEVFCSRRVQNYLLSSLMNTNTQKSWLVFDKEKLIGSIAIIDQEKDYELRGFYIAKEYRGKGIGKRLWEKARKFVTGKDIVLDIYAHNQTTIELYKHWGFIVDEERGVFYRHWPEWPEGLKAKMHVYAFEI